MIEGILSVGVFLFRKVIDAAKVVVCEVLASIMQDLGFEKSAKRVQQSKYFMERAKELNAEDEDLRRKKICDGKLPQRDMDRKQEIESLRNQNFTDYRVARQHEVVQAVEASPSNYSATTVSGDRLNLLQYHMGVTRVEKVCPTCGFPMVLNHRRGGGDSFADYFWACTRFFDGGTCKGLPFRASDIQLLHKAGVPELEIPQDQLDQFCRVPATVTRTRRRMDGHLRAEDRDVLCPLHHLPMVLLKKREHSGELLDMYHLRCPHLRDDWENSCNQIVKLKSAAQLAAFLDRQEGVGILPKG